MVYVRALIGTARMLRHTSRLAAGLVPDREVRLDAPDQRLSVVVAAAEQGDHRPAAALLAATRQGGEWESRDHCTGFLTRFARSRTDWLGRWLSTAAPYDPDALLMRAALAVDRAGRRPGREERLRGAASLIHAAAEAAPDDPVPWRIALDHARAVRAPRAAFAAHWAEAVRRSPHHSGCHVAALRYLTARCRAGLTGAAPGGRPGTTGGPGSSGGHRSSGGPAVPHPRERHDECLDFAERAAGSALPGSLLQALPARTILAHATGDSDVWSDTRVDSAVELGIGMSAQYAPGDPWPAEVRNVLAHVLIVRGRWGEALQQFRMIGPHATSFPWVTVSDDPLGQFLEMRDGTRIQVAATMPLWNRGGRTPSGGH